LRVAAATEPNPGTERPGAGGHRDPVFGVPAMRRSGVFGHVVRLLALLSALPAAAEEDLVARGEYLARIMDCTGCHTPGALAGQPDFERYLAGSDIGFEIPGLGIFYPPNLTPDPATGLGGWSAAEIADAVRNGVRPDGRELAPVMPWPSYAALSDEDAAALAAFLKSLPAIARQTPARVAAGQTPSAPYLTVVVPQ
jgi:mono/diheme cytochrome c family protein